MRLVATILFLFFYIPTWGCLRDLVRAGDGLAVWAIIGLLSFVAILFTRWGMPWQPDGPEPGSSTSWRFRSSSGCGRCGSRGRLRRPGATLAATSPTRSTKISRRDGRPSSSLPPGRPRISRLRSSRHSSLLVPVLRLVRAAAGRRGFGPHCRRCHEPIQRSAPDLGGDGRIFARDEQRRFMLGLGSVATALAILSAGIGVSNLVPYEDSDGATIKNALRPAWRR